MDSEEQELVDFLDEQIDDLTDSLGPLLTTSVQAIATKLPVADKARLYVLTTYAIESLIFSYLRLNGVDAKEHPIMRELTRIKGYVQKIKDAQPGKVTDKATLNKDVARRFIKHDLAGNDKWDAERAEQLSKEHAAAQAKLEELTKKIRDRQEKEDEAAAKETPASGSAEEDTADQPPKEDEYAEEALLDGLESEPEKEKEDIKNRMGRIMQHLTSHGFGSEVRKGKFEDPKYKKDTETAVVAAAATEDNEKSEKSKKKKDKKQKKFKKEAAEKTAVSSNVEANTAKKRKRNKKNDGNPSEAPTESKRDKKRRKAAES